MIGEREENRSSSVCAVCGGPLEKGFTNIPFFRDDRVFVVKGVPAEVCGDCGEAYMDGPTLDRTLDMVRAFEAAHTELSVARFYAA